MSPLPQRSPDPLPDIDTTELYDLATALHALRRDVTILCAAREGALLDSRLSADRLREDMANLGRWLLDLAGEPAELQYLVPSSKELAHARS